MISRLRTLAHPSLAAIGVGVLAVSLLGSGLAAVVSDSVSVTGASAQSDDYVFVEPVLDLEIGPITGIEDTNDPCTDPDFGVTYTTADAVAAGPTTETLDIAGWYVAGDLGATSPTVTIGQYCLRNASDTPGLVQVQLLSFASAEAGACGPTEAAVDSSCGAGDQGELGFNQLVKIGAYSSECVGDAFRRVDFDPASDVGLASPLGGAVLGSGDYCLVTVVVDGTRRTSVTEAEWQQVVSDTAEFDFAFNLVEAP